MKTVSSRYRKFGATTSFWLFRPSVAGGLIMCLLCTLAAAVAILPLGSVKTDMASILRWMMMEDVGADLALVLGELRLPRIALALLSGMMLGLSGAAMQSVTRNGLADPGLIGVKEGAVIVVLAIMFLAPTLSPVWRPFAALAGGGLVCLAVVVLAGSMSGLRFILIGVGVSWLLSSGIGLFMTMARISEVETAMIWLGGSLHAASWLDVQLVVPWAVVAASLLALTSRSAETATLGAPVAVGLGVRLDRTRGLVLLSSAISTSTVASAVGGLGFVGLIAPHLARMIWGGRQMPMLFGSGIIGAAMVLAADTIGRTLVSPLQVPAGVVLALLGVPFFLFILWKRRNEL